MSTYFEKITTPWPKGRVGGGGWVNPYGQPDRKKTEIVWPWKSILDDASCPDFFAAQSRSNNLIKDFGKYIVEMVGSIKFWERASAHRNQIKPNHFQFVLSLWISCWHLYISILVDLTYWCYSLVLVRQVEPGVGPYCPFVWMECGWLGVCWGGYEFGFNQNQTKIEIL